MICLKQRNRRLKPVNNLLLNKINRLLLHFRSVGKLKHAKLPLRDIRGFSEIPLTTKEELKGFDPMTFSACGDIHNVTATSGSTASRLLILHSTNCYHMHLRRIVKTYRCMGMKKGALCLNTCAYELNSGGRMMETAFKSLGAGVIPAGSFSTPEKLNEICHLIEKLKPDILNAYTNQLYDIFSRIKKRHSIKKCIVNGEPLFRSYQNQIEALAGVKIYNNYGSMEFSGFAMAESPRDEHMRLFEDGLYLEVLDERGRAEETGTGKIVVTDLENTCMPFIRYILGDEVEIIKKNNKKFIKVLRRIQDSILLEGEVVDKAKLIESIQEVLGHPHFFVLIIKNKRTCKDRLMLHVPRRDQKKAEKLNILLERQMHLGHLLTVRVYTGDVPRTSTGKLRHVIDLRKDV